MKHSLRFSAVLPLLFLAACSSNPKLSSNAPDNVSLSGTWLLVEDASDTIPSAANRARGERKSRGESGRGEGGRGRGGEGRRGEGRTAKGEGRSKSDRSGSNSADAYRSTRTLATLYAKTLRIEQDETSLGVGFHKLPYMDIDWGEKETAGGVIIAGWNADGHVVVFRKRERGEITETLSLDESGKILTQQVSFTGDRGERSFQRVFRLEEAKTNP